METKKPPKMSIGSVSLVVIFSTLCLTVFAVLSLITAKTEERLSLKSAQAVSNYYAADTRSAEIVEELFSLKETGASDSDIVLRAKELGVSVSANGDGLLLSFSEEVDSNQRLLIESLISEDDVRILTWQVKNTADWVSDESVSVWDGN